MAKNQRKKQQKALKKRQKRKAAAKKKRLIPLVQSPRAIVRKARQFPIMECVINSGWDSEAGDGLTRIVLSRQQPNGGIVFGAYMIDMFCLGLKNTFCNADFTSAQLREATEGVMSGAEPIECPVELAHQIIYQAIDYAAKFGFKPQKDFKWSQYVLERRGKLPESYNLTFGKDGKPFFIAGPYDNVDAIIAKLRHHVGEGNYHYMLPIGDDLLEDDDIEFLD